MRWREKDGARWLEAELPGGRAAFTSRAGGHSEGEFAGLNLGLLNGDREEAVRANRRTLATALGLDPDRVVCGRQVHGAGIAIHEGPQRPPRWSRGVAGLEGIPELDGHVLPGPGVAGFVLVADCLPIALAGPGGVAILHCGHRGLAAGIVGAGARAVRAEAAAIGPGIGPCCYEVGPEVLAAFAPLGPGVATGRMLDLKAVARRLLERAGVAEIDDCGLCTGCSPELFYSHRMQGPRTGRQGGLAWVEAG